MGCRFGRRYTTDPRTTRCRARDAANQLWISAPCLRAEAVRLWVTRPGRCPICPDRFQPAADPYPTHHPFAECSCPGRRAFMPRASARSRMARVRFGPGLRDLRGSRQVLRSRFIVARGRAACRDGAATIMSMGSSRTASDRTRCRAFLPERQGRTRPRR